MNVVFYLSAVVAILATVLTVTRSNAVHALLYFICSLLATGVMFFVLGAPLAATLVIIVNAGAIMVLFVFIVMMLNLSPHRDDREKVWQRPGAWLGPVLLSVVLAIELAYVLLRYQTGTLTGQIVGAKDVGFTLFGPYLLGAELASMLLLAGLVGAYHLGQGVFSSKGGSS